MRIGLVSLPLSGHLNPMTALARKLQSRGNDVVFISFLDAEPTVRAAKLPFLPICETGYPAGSINDGWSGVAKLQGQEVLRYSLQRLTPGLLKGALEDLPGKLVDTGVEALVIDTAFFYLELVALRLDIPYAQIWNVLHADLSGSTPSCIFGWPYSTTPDALARNLEGVKYFGELLASSSLPVAKSYAEKAGLEIDWEDPTATMSKVAVVTQTPREFDFPICNWPPQFHYAGPFHDNGGREPIPFPWEKLNSKPLVYASMGTLVNGLEHVYQTILEVIAALPELQLVLSVGHNIDPNDLEPLPPNAIVVRYAPQIELLKRAVLCITHAGLNTALESLAQGVPMVAIPVGYDQPGVAARIAHHGAGETVDLADLTVDRLSEVIQKVRSKRSYRHQARYFQKVIAQTNGLDVAAEVLEKAFGTNRTPEPVDRSAELSHA